MTKELTLIDLSSIFWQSYKALEHQPEGSAYDLTISRVYKYVNGDNPVAICIDTPPYKRSKIDPDYKANRQARPVAAFEILREVIERLDNDGFPVLGADGYEADDIIATVVEDWQSGERDIDGVHIISSDKDLSQLVKPRVTQTSVATGEVYDVNAVVEKFGVMPVELGDLLALMGDKSDNIPGVPGIGPKNAAVLLATHGWDNLIKLIDLGDPDKQIAPAGVRSALIMNFDNLIKSRELVRLMTDAPIDIESIFKPRVAKPETKKCKEVPPMDAGEKIKTPEVLEPVKSTSIVKADSWSLSLEPTSADGAFHMCKHFYNSRLYTKYASQEAIFAVVLRGRALGMDATTALDGFHVVEGRPTLSAPLMIGLVLRSNVCDYFKCTETTPQKATYITHRSDDPEGTPQKLSYTIEQAKGAELTALSRKGNKTNWHKRPETMLRWRCATELARMVYPDVVAGLYTPDEISDGQYIEAEVIQ